VDETVCAEGFGPGGCAVLVMAASPDAALRAAVREVLHRHGGRAGADNSVAYLFHPIGVLRVPGSRSLAARALEAGAEDVRPLRDGLVEVVTAPPDLPQVRDALARRGHVGRDAAVVRRAVGEVHLDPGQALRLQSLLAEIRALAGVAQVYTNAAVPEQFLATL
jgi:transcriptional/translational regulatory protein YebC/TACO1